MRPLKVEISSSLPHLSSANLQCIAELIQEEAGIVLSDDKSSLIMSRLGKRLKATKIPSFDGYCKFVRSAAGADERRQMLRALTTNVTRFFRESHHFEDLQNRVLAPLKQHVRSGGRLRIWSAACSSGEEPYSIALSVLSALPDAARCNVKILATDIDTEVIARAKEAAYPEHTVRNIPKDLAARYLHPVVSASEGLHSFTGEVRDMVSFKELNLLRPWPMKGPFHAIFCRNVFIYFNQDTQEMLIDRFASMLQGGGTLYLGHSERISGPIASRFDAIGHSTYKLK